MRIQSGITDQYIYFVAVDSTDYVTRETGLTTFTVYRSRNGGAATAYTTPTVAELSAANMPGVYSLLLDEDMTIDSGDDSQEICYHITQASMAPVTRTIELYRPIVTAGATITVANGAADADIERLQGNVIATPTVSGVLEVDVTHYGGSAGTFASGQPEVNTTHAAGTAWGSGAITAGVIAADAIGASELAADAASEIAAAVWDLDATAHQTQGTFGQAIGDPVADANTIYKAVVSDATGATVGVDVVALKAETVTILADTDNIQTRIPAALVSGRIDASVGAMAADVLTAAATAADFGTEIGTATWATAARTLTASLDPTAATIASAVWDLDATAHQTQGTFGQVLGDSGADADSVWLLANTNLDATISSRASQTSVDDLPTNAELATALGTADDATLAAIAALNDLSSADVTAAVPTANANADALLDRAAGVETGLTPREAWRLVAAACAGKASGLATATAIYRNPVADSKERITATVDADGNRTAITYDLT